MPFLVFGASSSQGGDLVAPPMQHDEESFTSPVLRRTRDDADVALDFQGRKHVSSSEDGDDVYVLQADTLSSHTKFTMPGQATVNALRDYLFEHLQPHQVVDSYGSEREMSQISNDHLAVLQAKMWAKNPHRRSPRKVAFSRPSRAQVVIADHISKISQLLEGSPYTPCSSYEA
jgi:hypothetical protein